MTLIGKRRCLHSVAPLPLPNYGLLDPGTDPEYGLTEIEKKQSVQL